MTIVRICFLLVCAWAFAGCTIGRPATHTMNKPYSPIQQLDSHIPETRSIVWEKLKWNPTLRTQPSAVGVKMDMISIIEDAYVFTIPKPQKWLTEAAKLEFKGVGLEEGVGNADDPRISIIVDQFFVELAGLELTAVTILDVSVNLPKQGKMFQRRFVGEKVKLWMGGPGSNSEFDYTLLTSAQLAFHEAIQETRKLIDREER